MTAGHGDDHVRLITTDPEVAAKYGMHDEGEFFDAPPGSEQSEQP